MEILSQVGFTLGINGSRSFIIDTDWNHCGCFCFYHKLLTIKCIYFYKKLKALEVDTCNSKDKADLLMHSQFYSYSGCSDNKVITCT